MGSGGGGREECEWFFQTFFVGLLWICPLGQDEATERDDGAATGAGRLFGSRSRTAGRRLAGDTPVSQCQCQCVTAVCRSSTEDNHEWQTQEAVLVVENFGFLFVFNNYCLMMNYLDLKDFVS